jgi:hypothetical protein
MALLGPGEEYIKFLHQSKPNRDPSQLTRALKELQSRLNSVALFLMEKSFRHVRYE